MKKIDLKDKSKKASSKDLLADKAGNLEETPPEEAHIAAELDPEILNVFVKPKKSKNSVDATDYVPELERGDVDEDPGPDTGGF